jgi:CBS domain-containing protein
MDRSGEGRDRTPVRLSIRTLRVLGPGGECSDALNVFCPRLLHTTSLAACLSCPRLVSKTPGSIECVAGALDCPAPDPFDLRLGADVRVGNATAPETFCVSAEAMAAVVVRSLKEQGASVAVVVDPPDRFVGLLDLETATLAGQGVPVGDIARCISPVRETASLAFAVERMVHERARALPVVDDEGFLVALVSDIDALRWVATRARKTPAPNP